MSRTTRDILFIGLCGTLTYGCGDAPIVPSDGNGDTATDAGEVSGSVGTDGASRGADTTGGVATADVDGSSGASPEESSSGPSQGESTDGAGSCPDPPLGGSPHSCECGLWSQECGDGLRCVAVEAGGTICTAVAEEPAELGEPCEVAGFGFDDCRPGALCWPHDPESERSVCLPFCEDFVSDPSCVSIGGCLSPRCDPLAQDCPQEQECYGAGSARGRRRLCAVLRRSFVSRRIRGTRRGRRGRWSQRW